MEFFVCIIFKSYAQKQCTIFCYCNHMLYETIINKKVDAHSKLPSCSSPNICLKLESEQLSSLKGIPGKHEIQTWMRHQLNVEREKIMREVQAVACFRSDTRGYRYTGINFSALGMTKRKVRLSALSVQHVYRCKQRKFLTAENTFFLHTALPLIYGTNFCAGRTGVRNFIVGIRRTDRLM